MFFNAYMSLVVPFLLSLLSFPPLPPPTFTSPLSLSTLFLSFAILISPRIHLSWFRLSDSCIRTLLPSPKQPYLYPSECTPCSANRTTEQQFTRSPLKRFFSHNIVNILLLAPSKPITVWSFSNRDNTNNNPIAPLPGDSYQTYNQKVGIFC